MTILQMLIQSVILTLLGMAVVFGFLIVLILVMKALHAFVHAFKLDKDIETSSLEKVKKPVPSSPVQNKVPEEDEKALVAAIAAAVKEKLS